MTPPGCSMAVQVEKKGEEDEKKGAATGVETERGEMRVSVIFLLSAVSNDLKICKSITFVLVNLCVRGPTEFIFSKLSSASIKIFLFLSSMNSVSEIPDEKFVFSFSVTGM